jgi:hypothetical protein
MGPPSLLQLRHALKALAGLDRQRLEQGRLLAGGDGNPQPGGWHQVVVVEPVQ